MRDPLETKKKGDIGLTQVIADLTIKGFNVALPIAEHLPYDILVISPEHQIRKLSIKYVGEKNNSIALPLRSVSTNMQGWKAKTVNFSNIDGFAVYCPQHKNVYYISTNNVKHLKNAFILRNTPPSKAYEYHPCQNFLDPQKLFL